MIDMRTEGIIFRLKISIEFVFGIALVCILTSCAELKRPVPNPYLAETQPPPIQELRWSNGVMPKTLDPARAGAAPEIDIVRAIYEGLTVIDPKTLEAVPGVAESWIVSEDGLVWTFKLRDDAKWSNGRAVTASDFVRSWQRLNKLGAQAAHSGLLDNLARVDGNLRGNGYVTKELQESEGTDPVDASTPERPADSMPELEPEDDLRSQPYESGTATESSEDRNVLDIRATDTLTFVVKLARPDRDFARVAAHPIFSPAYPAHDGQLASKPNAKAVTNGAFKTIAIDDGSITLERSGTYWNRGGVALDRIIFISASKPDEALIAYRDGKVDVVTNTEFAPLAQKLFSPYADFKRSTFAALNYYEVNYRKAPFSDRRVREALAISIEREKLSDAELEGTTQPAFSFLPFSLDSKSKIVQDRDRAAELLEQAGYPNGSGFPPIRLVVNRNEVQQRVARAAARMWKANLNIETDIVLAEPAELEDAHTKGDFDILRRGVVFPANSEFTSLDSLFAASGSSEISATQTAGAMPSPTGSPASQQTNSENGTASDPFPQLTEAQALFELHAIPLYFPISFALVKPYVEGFEMNSLDVWSPTSASINRGWHPEVK